MAIVFAMLSALIAYKVGPFFGVEITPETPNSTVLAFGGSVILIPLFIFYIVIRFRLSVKRKVQNEDN